MFVQSWLDPAKVQLIGFKFPSTFGKLNSQATLGDLDSDHLSKLSLFHIVIMILPLHKGTQLQLKSNQGVDLETPGVLGKCNPYFARVIDFSWVEQGQSCIWNFTLGFWSLKVVL